MPTLHDDDTDALLTQAAGGDARAVAELLDRQRPRLKRLVALRIDARIAARVDPSDVIQEALLDASQALDRFIAERPLPFYPWLRQIVLSRLMQVHRFHLHTQRRAVGREVEPLADDRSGSELARQFVAPDAAPADQAIRVERLRQVEAAVGQLTAIDRELLVLRYAERLSPAEAAATLGVSANAYAQRHVRALRRLRRLLQQGEGLA